MQEPESIRQICARLVREHRERRDDDQFQRLVSDVESNPRLRLDRVPLGSPVLKLDGIDREFLRSLGIEA